MRLLGSLSFRLTVLYSLAFGLSFILLLGAYYLVNVYLPIQAVKAAALAESSQLARVYRDEGASALAAALELRATTANDRTGYHVLVAGDGSVLAQNLPTWPDPGPSPWLNIEADIFFNGGDIDHTALVYDRALGDGARLLVGRDIEDLRQRQSIVFDAARWMTGGGLLFGLFGGVLMSRAIGRRIDSINVTARQVMTGDLDERIPTQGSGDDFDRLAETLNLMLHRIQRLLEAIRRVSDSVAHELRTPLTRLHADLSELSIAVTPENRPLVEGAVAEAEKLIGLFDAVLRIARIESAGEGIVMEEIDMSGLLSDAVEMFGPSAEAKDVSLAASIAPGLTVNGNKNLIFQAIGNLLDNAIKYAPAKGRVSLEAAESAEGVRVCIADNGVGIPIDQRQNVLERFVRLQQTADVPGIGLGLSFVKAAVDAHRSVIELEDAHPGLRVRWRFLPRDANA